QGIQVFVETATLRVGTAATGRITISGTTTDRADVVRLSRTALLVRRARLAGGLLAFPLALLFLAFALGVSLRAQRGAADACRNQRAQRSTPRTRAGDLLAESIEDASVHDGPPSGA